MSGDVMHVFEHEDAWGYWEKKQKKTTHKPDESDFVYLHIHIASILLAQDQNICANVSLILSFKRFQIFILVSKLREKFAAGDSYPATTPSSLGLQIFLIAIYLLYFLLIKPWFKS